MFSHQQEASRGIRATAALQQWQAWEKALAVRVAIQKPLDIANKLPVTEIPASTDDFSRDAGSSIPSGGVEDLADAFESLADGIRTTLDQAISAISMQTDGKEDDTYNDNEMSDTRSSPDSFLDRLWKKAYHPQQVLEEKKWKPVLNKWHARVNFGSEQTKSQLKVFKRNFWDQIEESTNDPVRSVEKSRILMEESPRIGKRPRPDVACDERNDDDIDRTTSDEESVGFGERLDRFGPNGRKGDAQKRSGAVDMEVYDDRMFYSLLLKTFITSATGGSTGSTMRAEDLEALRQYKRRKLNVDRKASKGRKIRYTVHEKLQNFMFPVPTVNSSGIDSDRLFMSLFQ